MDHNTRYWMKARNSSPTLHFTCIFLQKKDLSPPEDGAEYSLFALYSWREAEKIVLLLAAYCLERKRLFRRSKVSRVLWPAASNVGHFLNRRQSRKWYKRYKWMDELKLLLRGVKTLGDWLKSRQINTHSIFSQMLPVEERTSCVQPIMEGMAQLSNKHLRFSSPKT